MLPKNSKKRIHEITHLNFCDEDCDCGENNQLWWVPVTASERRCMPEWVPGWMNGVDTDEIWQWLVQNGKAA